MKIPKQEDLAILFMTELAVRYPDGATTSLSEVAGKHGVSVLFLKKIVRQLHLHKLVVSKEGSGGGYTLAYDPAKISIWDVMEAVDERMSTPKIASEVCPLLSDCLPQHIKQIINNSLKTSLTQISLRDFLI